MPTAPDNREKKLTLPLKCKVTVVPIFLIEIEGNPSSTQLSVEKSWEGMVKLSNPNNCSDTIIIHDPPRPSNHFDLIPKMLGGNADNGVPYAFEAEVVKLGHNFINLIPKDRK